MSRQRKLRGIEGPKEPTWTETGVSSERYLELCAQHRAGALRLEQVGVGALWNVKYVALEPAPEPDSGIPWR